MMIYDIFFSLYGIIAIVIVMKVPNISDKKRQQFSLLTNYCATCESLMLERTNNPSPLKLPSLSSTVPQIHKFCF